MNRYRQLTSGERYALSALRKQGYNQAAIARALGRHRSTISREVRRNSKDRQGRAYRDVARIRPDQRLAAVSDSPDFPVVFRPARTAPAVAVPEALHAACPTSVGEVHGLIAPADSSVATAPRGAAPRTACSVGCSGERVWMSLRFRHGTPSRGPWPEPPPPRRAGGVRSLI